MDKEFLKGHLPILVLGLLENRPMHGYAICEALSSEQNVQLNLSEGTLYPLLHRLERQGHVRAVWTRGETGKERKTYHITKSGRVLIKKHHSDFRELSVLFQNVFGKGWIKG